MGLACADSKAASSRPSTERYPPNRRSPSSGCEPSAGDIAYFDGRVQLIWGDREQVIPYTQVEAFQAATAEAAKRTTVVTIPEADHGYGFYSIQPEVDAILHSAVVDFFRKALR